MAVLSTSLTHQRKLLIPDTGLGAHTAISVTLRKQAVAARAARGRRGKPKQETTYLTTGQLLLEPECPALPLHLQTAADAGTSSGH